MIKKLFDCLFPTGPKGGEEGFEDRAREAFREALAKVLAKGERLDEFKYKEGGFGWSRSRTWNLK